MNNVQTIRAYESIRSSVGIREINSIRAIQIQRGAKPCFMTSERLFCKSGKCEWRQDCRKLVAVWKR